MQDTDAERKRWPWETRSWQLEADRIVAEMVGAADQEGEVDRETVLSIGRRSLKEELRQWAQEIVDDFWSVHWRYRVGDGVPKAYGHYGVRVLEREWTIYIQWYRMDVSGTSARLYRRMTALKPAVGGRLSKKSYARALPWEAEAISRAEDELVRVRRCAERLDRIRLELSSVTQLLQPYRERHSTDSEQWDGPDD